MFVDVAAAADLPEAGPLLVKVDKREIVLIRWNQQVYALRNVCPHQKQSFEQGVVRGQVRSDAVGEVDSAEAGCATIVCPWHRWQFDLTTGNCLTDESYRVRSYATKIEGDRLLVDIGHTRASK
ncbi:Rieske (2Fe-2S) protein [Rhodococcus koreensis]